MLLSPILGIWLRMPPVGARNEAATEVLADPEVRLSLTGRSGPLVVEIEYRVAQDNARAVPQCDAGSAAQPPAQRRLRLVDRARHRRSPNYGPSAITARPGWIICASATARRNPNARCISGRSTSTSVPSRSACAACWSGRSDRCAGRKTRPTAQPTKCCRSRPRRGAVLSRHSGACVARAWNPFIRVTCRPMDPGLIASRCPQMRNCASGNDGEMIDYRPVGGKLQGLLTRLAEAGAVLLQARQHDLVTIVHLGAAKPRRVAGAGVMALLLRRSG